MRSPALFLSSLCFVSMAACTPQGQTPANDTSSSSLSSVEETQNVSFSGIVSKLGASIYTEGTHKLTLDDGRFVLLESDTIDLDNYIGQHVEVAGDARPTVEAGGTIMTVRSVFGYEDLSSSSLSSGSGTLSSSGSLSSAVSLSSSAVSSVRSSTPMIASSSAPSSAPASSVASSSAPAANDLSAKTAEMAKADMSPANWTQKFCSAQIAFCTPVHKNWWFKSFGTTSSYLGHVEIGTEEMNSLGEGPISINLVAGAISTVNMSDGQIVTQGNTVTGYRAWSGDRHLEITAPAVLIDAVRYITQNLTPTATQ